jgi:uncharacterized SAM-dependent methyltransferase
MNLKGLKRVVKKMCWPVSWLIYDTVLDASPLDVSLSFLSRQAKRIETECYGVAVVAIVSAAAASATAVPF